MYYKSNSKSNGMVALIRSQVRFISSFRNIFFLFCLYAPPPPSRDIIPLPPFISPPKTPYELSYVSPGPKAEWAIDSEAMRARGIFFLVKSN